MTKKTEGLAPSNITPIPYGRLMRAPENVRKTDIAADVESLADDIAAHGLLQSLIGYAGDTDIDKNVVWIVGGGRRLQALQLLHERGVITDEWPVSVLIRQPGEAIELSLSENLQRRDMNPADEYQAFAALMKSGTTSPADLAKRFGFTERYVKQRLRLADLAPDILEAVRECKIGVESAMAYARVADQKLQMKVFTAQSKPNNAYNAHNANTIKWAYDAEQLKTTNAIFLYVGAEAYEAAGGDYEDEGLFDALDPNSGRRLTRGDLLLSIATRRASYDAPALIEAEKQNHPSLEEFILTKNLTQAGKADVKTGYVELKAGWMGGYSQYVTMEKIWSKIDEHKVPCYVPVFVGTEWPERAEEVDGEEGTEVEPRQPFGTVKIDTSRVYIPKAMLATVLPPQKTDSVPQKTDEEIAAEKRQKGIDLWAQRLAVGPFAGTPLEGKAFWPTGWQGDPQRGTREGVEGWKVPINIFVTDEEVAQMAEAAGKRYDEWLVEEAERVAEVERKKAEEAAAKEIAEAERVEQLATMLAEIEALTDEPAVISVEENFSDDPYPHFRQADGRYVDEVGDTSYGDLAEVLENALRIAGHWPTREAFDEARERGEDGTARLVDEDEQEDA